MKVKFCTKITFTFLSAFLCVQSLYAPERYKEEVSWWVEANTAIRNANTHLPSGLEFKERYISNGFIGFLLKQLPIFLIMTYKKTANKEAFSEKYLDITKSILDCFYSALYECMTLGKVLDNRGYPLSLSYTKHHQDIFIGITRTLFREGIMLGLSHFSYMKKFKKDHPWLNLTATTLARNIIDISTQYTDCKIRKVRRHWVPVAPVIPWELFRS